MSDVPPDSRTPPPVMMGGDPTVHLGYMRRDLDDLKRNQDANFRSLTDLLAEIRDGHVTKEEFGEHLKSASDHEVRIRTLERAMWKYVGAASAAAAAVSYLVSGN